MRSRINDVMMWWGFLAIAAAVAILLIPWPTTDRATAFYRQTQVDALATAAAVENFVAEYDQIPDPGPSWLETEGPAGTWLLRILLGEDEEQNPRVINFLSVREAREKKAGLHYPDDNALPDGLYDSYGEPFRVALNLDQADPFSFRYNGEDVILSEGLVAVWSVGKDGIEGTKDDVRSWGD